MSFRDLVDGWKDFAHGAASCFLKWWNGSTARVLCGMSKPPDGKNAFRNSPLFIGDLVTAR